METTADDNCLNVDTDRNYASESNYDYDFDDQDVVIRHPRGSSSYLLADGGDGAEADLLGTTPPRSRIRNKEIRKTNIGSELLAQRGLRNKKNENAPRMDNSPPISDRIKKRTSLKLYRTRERDFKLDMIETEQRPESMPWPFPAAGRMPAVPTLVESCNRFMCLTSRLKSRENNEPEKAPDSVEDLRSYPEEELPESRVNFHKTFSMLINMGNNIEKGCRRTISREEQVWQNELKDLIWLELQAKVAGRTLAQQDAYLCSQRNAVPTILQNIMDYKFVNPNRCTSHLCAVEGSREDLADECADCTHCHDDDEAGQPGCLSFNCRHCTDAIAKAMKEISSLLDSFYSAVELYPSSKAMTVEHPLIATNVFKSRLKAMCVWYNIALHMRLKMLAVCRMMRSLRLKRRRNSRTSLDSGISRQSSSAESTKQCQVRFNISGNPSDSSNSEASNHSDGSKEACAKDEEDTSREETAKFNSDGDIKDAMDDEVDSGISHGDTTDGETVIGACTHVPSETGASSESGYSSGAEGAVTGPLCSLAALADLTRLRLLGACSVSPYRQYHHEMLKTQGVRRCMIFINKLRKNVLHKVHITLEKPDSTPSESFQEEETAQVFDDTKEEDKTEPPRDEELEKTYELRRYGCWSAECLAMRLPSYRSHFLLLSTICMEAVHDYLSLRLDTRPARPSCLTVTQLIHELKEGLDISTEMRHEFVGNVSAALQGARVTPAARRDLALALRTYDDTVEGVLKQYLSYLSTMSETQHVSRAWLQAEWAFTARLARRVKCAAMLAPLTFADISCNQISRLLKDFKNKFDELVELEKSVHYAPNRYTAYVMCRAVQDIYARWREPLLQAAQWARALAAKLARAHPPAFQAQRAAIFNKLMSMREFTLKHTEIVLERTRVPDEELELTEGLVTRIRELLLQMFKLGFEIHKELHRGVNDVPGRMVGPRRSLANSPPKLTLRAKFARSESIGEDAVFDDKLFECYGENHHEASIERLLSGEDQQQDTVQLRSGSVSEASVATAASEEREWAARVARAVIQFARCWMRFVVERCDRGRGLRPRWASQGLEFLMLACDPCNTKHLSEEEFEELKELMDGCISHVVGSRPRVDVTLAPRPRHRLQSPSPSSPNASPNSTTSTPSVEPEPPTDQILDQVGHKKRVLEAVQRLEEERDSKLRASNVVGVVRGAAQAGYEPRLKQVTFKWQRGLKIGAGTFGKVYTVVNTESGQLLAMKELSIGAGDRRALQRAANELGVLEGVIHPHLVRYYGCELHREEMLIFMELCVEGSLEALLVTSGALDEPIVRRYTKQLLSAVHELHSKNIVHRDIKSGNIFLTNEGHCLKLGDFGCAVKIRANTTAPGELQGFVGTQAYMAPEVFMKSSGHGRAADVWSLGCVVTEMASGKRPFSEYDSNYQIMFVVGMGGRPEIPADLSEEGRDFCHLCLTHEPDKRPRATQLSTHHFLMVKNDDDCKCEPAFLLP